MMSTRRLTYFVSDVHLGLKVADPDARERRFADFLNGLPQETDALYLLGDIWDFWYEYRDVVPKGYVRVLAALQNLMDRGVKVYFFQGNHDVWTYSYFEELGMKRLEQPAVVEIGDKVFCLGHGDGLGPVPMGYRFLRGVFHSRILQFLFSLLHPWLAFRLGNGFRYRVGNGLGVRLAFGNGLGNGVGSALGRGFRNGLGQRFRGAAASAGNEEGEGEKKRNEQKTALFHGSSPF
jgi:UDP-2,3-diacylglucosamine hydrolase